MSEQRTRLYDPTDFDSLFLDVQIDNRDERKLLSQAARFLEEISGGQLTNLSAANPLIYLLEAQVFAGAELLWYVNQLPAKLASYWLARFGLKVIDPIAATGLITLTLTQSFPTPVTLPILDVTDGITTYRTNAPTTFPINTRSIEVSATAINTGVDTNATPFTINRIVTPVPFLQSVINILAFSNGSDGLDDGAAVIDFIKGNQDQQLISVADYVRVVKKQIGDDAVVKVVPSYNPDTQLSTNTGNIAVLIGRPLLPYSIEALKLVSDYLQTLAPITSLIQVGALEFQPIDIVLSIETIRSDKEAVSQLLYASVLQMIGQGKVTVTLDDMKNIAYSLGVSCVFGSINSVERFTAINPLAMLELKSLLVNISNPSSLNYKPKETLSYFYGQGDED